MSAGFTIRSEQDEDGGTRWTWTCCDGRAFGVCEDGPACIATHHQGAQAHLGHVGTGPAEVTGSGSSVGMAVTVLAVLFALAFTACVWVLVGAWTPFVIVACMSVPTLVSGVVTDLMVDARRARTGGMIQ